MTTAQLEQAIQQCFLDIYGKHYIGRMHITKLNPKGYHIRFGLNTPDKPMVVAAELDDDAFLKFIREEIKARRFNLVFFGEVLLDYPVPCNPVNKSCDCNDKG